MSSSFLCLVNFTLSLFCMLGGCTTPVPLVNLLIFDINRVMVKRWFKQAPSDISLDLQLHRVSKHIVLLRPRLIEFLAELGSHYDVGTWSSITPKNLMLIFNLIENEVTAMDSNFKFKFHFSQEECVQQAIIYHFERTKEILFLKPFTSLLHKDIQMDPMHTLLIDDTPDKGYLNPLGTTCCVKTYNDDSNAIVLLEKLLPYL